MIYVGSKALSFYTDVNYKDIDLIGTTYEAEKLITSIKPKRVKRNEQIITLFDIEQTKDFDRNIVEILLSDKSVSINMYYEKNNYSEELIPANIETLYSLKKSHIHFPKKFDSHIIHYDILHKMCNGIDIYKDITKINFQETEKRLGKLRTPKLNKTTEEFFGQSEDYVKSYYIHDDIHKAVAYNEEPVYEKLQKKEGSVWCSKDLWNNLTEEEKMQCVLEEAYVISLERKILPCLYGGGKFYTAENALKWSLMRICTNLCSGYFREYATNNYVKIWEYKNDNYVQDFLTKSKNIKRIN
jgi:hypothetical protein